MRAGHRRFLLLNEFSPAGSFTPANRTNSTPPIKTKVHKAPVKRTSTRVNPQWKALSSSLSGLGLTRAYVREVILPSWWEPAVLEEPNGLLETVGIIHRRTRLPLSQILQGTAHWSFPSEGIKFKGAAGKSKAEMACAQALATQVAELLATGINAAPSTIPDAATLHADLKRQGSKPWVTLEDIVTWAWQNGIAVAAIPDFPSGKKPDGMAIKTKDGCPIVILCKKTKQPAWQIFTLAHELGHFAHGHVPEGGTILDKFLDDSEGNPQNEAEEDEANAYAARLTTGHDNLGLSYQGKMHPGLLAKLSLNFARSNRISPGVVALNWAFTTKEWTTANAALKTLEGAEDAFEVINRVAAQHLAWNNLPDDSQEWLERMTGIASPA